MKTFTRTLISVSIVATMLSSCAKPQDSPTITSSPQAATTAETPEGDPTPTQVASAEGGFVVADSKGAVVDFTPTSSKIDLRRDTRKSTLVLSTYEFELAPMSANSIAPLTSNEQKRIHIGLDAKNTDGASYENPLPTGEYQATFVDLLTFDNAESRENFENEKGTIVITEINEDQVKGKVDISADGGAKVQGDFVADIAK